MRGRTRAAQAGPSQGDETPGALDLMSAAASMVSPEDKLVVSHFAMLESGIHPPGGGRGQLRDLCDVPWLALLKQSGAASDVVCGWCPNDQHCGS